MIRTLLLTSLLAVASYAQNNPTNPSGLAAGCANSTMLGVASTAYSVMGVTQVFCINNLQYGSVGQSSCTVNLGDSCEVLDCYIANYTTAAAAANNIYVIAPHSGGDNTGSRSSVLKLTNGYVLLAQWLGPGYTVVAPDYILASIVGATPVNPSPKQWQDMRQIIGYLQANQTKCPGNINKIEFHTDSMSTFSALEFLAHNNGNQPFADSGPNPPSGPYTIIKLGATYPSINQGANCSNCGLQSVSWAQNEPGIMNGGATATATLLGTLTLSASIISCTSGGCQNFTYAVPGNLVWLSTTGVNGSYTSYPITTVTSNTVVLLSGSPPNGSYYVAGPTGPDNFSLTGYQGVLGTLPGNASSPYACWTLACVTTAEAADVAGQFSPIWYANCSSLAAVAGNIFLGYGLLDNVVPNDNQITFNTGLGTNMNGAALVSIARGCGVNIPQNGYIGGHEVAISATTPFNPPVEDLWNFLRSGSYGQVRRRF